MTSQKDTSTESQTPENYLIVKDFSYWKKKAKERKLQKAQKEKIESNQTMEEEIVKAEAQEDIGGEFSLLQCCMQFVQTPEKLFGHIKNHHDKDTTKCVLCGKELSSKSSLDRHLLIHAKWQPYKCNHCHKQFSTNGNMHRHRKTHNGLCKGLKFVKEDQKVNKECSPSKKTKRNLKYNYGASYRIETSSIHFNGASVSGEKRKSGVEEASKSEQPVKKMKSCCMENVETTYGNDLVDTENKNEILDAKTYPLSPDSQPGVHEPSDGNSLKALRSLPNFLSKEEFINKLGLKTACRLDAKLGPASNSQLDNPLDIQTNKNECIALKNSSRVNVKKQLFKKEHLLLGFTTSQVVEQPDPPLKEVDQELKGNVDNTSNVDKHWLPESPETSAESSCEPLFKPLDDTKNDNPQPQYLCQECGKEFKNIKAFHKHLLKHQKQKYFKCTICDAKLLSRQNATRHVVKIHKEKKSQARSLIVENLDNDVISAGTKTQCEWCGEEFTSSLILEHHKRASIGCQAKPFICLICNKSFSTKNNGKRHHSKYHKDVNDDACIVRNVMASNNGVVNDPRAMDSSASACSTAIDDAPQENSGESDPPEESDLSLPKKELDAALDAAQSLIEMSSSAPFHRSSGDETITDQPHTNSSSPAQDNSCFYIPVHIPVNVQNKPLDLSVHPMDLSSKSNESTDRLQPDGFRRLTYPFTFPVSPNSRSSDIGIFYVEKHNDIPTETPLNLVKKKDCDINNHFSQLLQSPVSLAPNLFESKNHSPMVIDGTIQNESNNPKSSVLYECNLCSMSFSTNSNKRRHEKTKHLMHCNGPQSSKTPPGFFSSKEKPVASTPKSVLSKKTKEALISKVSSVKSADFEPVDFSINSEHILSQPIAIIGNESETGDLASVSSLISTANSPQLKKYLTADNACDVTATKAAAPSEVKDDQDSPKSVNQTISSAKSSNKHWCAVCQKQFTCKSALERHSSTHTNQRDHHCQVCKKPFTTKSNRDRHMKRIHRLILSRDNKKLMPIKKQQKKFVTIVPSESSTVEMDLKDLTLPKEMVNSEISQCNKENQRLFMPS